ncbi:unnamed protein product [Protopolystoma xenopodis]|uniref:Uncharacterized protein n=1 Tax=Protopolystoma xenopodis TaxID=117903 RepID=A0A3S5A3T5_9PLAT|nr:unnamed protein product [Protopolystoma xenopodis]
MHHVITLNLRTHTYCQFQRYVALIRNKNTQYKQLRSQLNELRAEKGILTWTLDRLRSEEAEAEKALRASETAQGISGYWETQAGLEKTSGVA